MVRCDDLVHVRVLGRGSFGRVSGSGDRPSAGRHTCWPAPVRVCQVCLMRWESRGDLVAVKEIEKRGEVGVSAWAGIAR